MLGTRMNARKLGAICALLAATPNLIGCESSRDSPDRQFQKQVKRAQECRELQDKLVGDQPLTPERAEEIAKTMDRTGCTARLPAHSCWFPHPALPRVIDVAGLFPPACRFSRPQAPTPRHTPPPLAGHCTALHRTNVHSTP